MFHLTSERRLIPWMILHGIALVIFLAPACTHAGQTLADADWAERDLGAGVVWRHFLFNGLFDSMQSVSLVEVDLTDPSVSIEIPHLVTDRQRISAMIPSQFPGAVAGINGTYFNTSVGGHRTYLRIDDAEIPPGGALFPEWGYEGALALDAVGDATIEEMPVGGWALDTTHPDIIACGPLLIVDGVIPSAHLAAIGSHSTARHPRSAIGITADDRLFLVTVDGRTDLAAGMTCEELAQVMEQLGCVDAYNLDGGGSTTLWGAGELHGGVLNCPSDNGEYDHSGERSCVNGVAILAGPPSPAMWDARLTDKTFSELMITGTQQTVTLEYENAGTQTWSSDDIRFVLARPASRTSVFHDAATWVSPTQPALMTPASVGPGASATFEFVLQAPEVGVATVINEHFMLTREGAGRFGPADSEAWMRISVQPPVSAEETFIVESRPGGQNSTWYSDDGMANSGTNCTAPGCTGDIGTRYGSTYRSVAGFKAATVAPDFPAAGDYAVHVAWGAGSNRRSPITYHVNHAGGTDTFQIDQTATANVWVPLGTAPYSFDAGQSGSVVMTNENIDVSGSMNAGAVMFEYIPPEQPDQLYVVRRLGFGESPPVIDGTTAAGEWDSASPAGTGFVVHDDPGTAAAEDGSFRMLSSDTHLHILFQMDNARLAGFPSPPEPPAYTDLLGDKINFFLTPGGVNAEPFCRVLLSPNPTDGVCHIWSQASTIRTTNPTTGTDWLTGGDAAFSHTAGELTIECRIPWSAFDCPGMGASTPPEDGAVWGVQPAISNELSVGNWEYVNWEPDDTPSYVHGIPFGALEFRAESSAVTGWTVR